MYFVNIKRIVYENIEELKKIPDGTLICIDVDDQYGMDFIKEADGLRDAYNDDYFIPFEDINLRYYSIYKEEGHSVYKN